MPLRIETLNKRFAVSCARAGSGRERHPIAPTATTVTNPATIAYGARRRRGATGVACWSAATRPVMSGHRASGSAASPRARTARTSGGTFDVDTLGSTPLSISSISATIASSPRCATVNGRAP